MIGLFFILPSIVTSTTTDGSFSNFGISFNSTGGTNTYAQAIDYGRTHPTRDGGTWSGWCAAFMVRAGNLPSSSVCPSAIDVYHRSSIISKDIMAAPSGAFHYWDIGQYGHVAMAMPNGWSMMASCHVTKSWGDCVGSTPVATYTSTVGATYLGWSYDYAGAEIADVRITHPTIFLRLQHLLQEYQIPITTCGSNCTLLSTAMRVLWMVCWELTHGLEHSEVCAHGGTQVLTMVFPDRTHTKQCNAWLQRGGIQAL